MGTTTTDLSPLWVARLLQASDSLYPTGAYAHSFGLEGLTQEGSVAALPALREFVLDHALPALAATDLPVAARAWAAAGEPVDWNRLRRLCQLGSALRGARELREGSEAIGRQRAALAARLHGGVAAEFERRALAGGWPTPGCVSAAIEARAIGAPLEAVLAGLIYSTAAGLVSSAVKLLRLGQNAAQGLLAEALNRVPVLTAAALAAGEDELGSFNPWWDIASARHEAADFRLFIS
jgi:urease accessory protein